MFRRPGLVELPLGAARWQLPANRAPECPAECAASPTFLSIEQHYAAQMRAQAEARRAQACDWAEANYLHAAESMAETLLIGLNHGGPFDLFATHFDRAPHISLRALVRNSTPRLWRMQSNQEL